jgi:uncharacterized membrane protein
MWIPGQEANKPAPRAPVVNIPVATAPAAGKPAQPAQLKDNLIAALAYITFIPAIVFLFVERFKRNHFVRFHSIQSILLAVATILMAIAMRILYSVLTLIPVLGYLLAWLAVTVAVLGWVILWLVLLVKALQGETFRLPLIGNLAEKA